MTDKQIIQKGQAIIDEFLKLLQVDAKTKLSMEVDEEDSKFLKISIEGGDLGALIGYKGYTLNSIQTIFSQIINSEVGESMTVMVDVNGYRDKRKSYLQSLAKRACEEAKESGQSIGLPPLSAFERRVIHMAVKEEERVITESEGEGEDRHVVVKLKETRLRQGYGGQAKENEKKQKKKGKKEE